MSPQREYVIVVDDHGRGYRVPRSVLTSPNERKLAMRPDTITLIVDQAARDGRISADDRDPWRRFFEASPTEATEAISQLKPDPTQAQRNYFALDENERKYEDFAGTLGLSGKETA